MAVPVGEKNIYRRRKIKSSKEKREYVYEVYKTMFCEEFERKIRLLKSGVYMNIRLMTEKDYGQTDRLMQQVHELHLVNRPDLYAPLEHPYSKSEFVEMIENENIVAILAEDDYEVLGICIVTMRTKTCMVEKCTAYMEDLCVEKNHRGKGIGKALFYKAEEISRQKGAKRLDLMVWAFNEDAMRFYESLGMRPQRYIYEKKL